MNNQGRRRNIVGPQSALTDFLASHNISANRIRLDAEARRRAAANQPNQEGNDGSATNTDQASASNDATAPTPAADSAPDSAPITAESPEATATAEQTPQRRQRSAEQKKAIEKIKASKRFKKRKLDEDEEDEMALAIYEANAAPLPGQMENCDLCRKRFTVTPYSRSGPSGGLLCNPCGKELDKEDFGAKKKAKLAKGRAGAGRRKMQSNILDGTFRTGPQSLMALCIKTLARNIDLADELGDLPPGVVDKIARELSKHRLLDSRSIKLFLQPEADDIRIYDAAKLTEDDLVNIFQIVPGLKRLKIRNGIQFKDSVMEYLISRHITLEGLYLHGSNLVSEQMWIKFLEEKGSFLKSFRVYFTDKHFGDSSLTILPSCCPNLECLKVRHNEQVTAAGVKAVADIPSLKKLAFFLKNSVHSDVYVHVLGKIGRGLETFSLSTVPTADNTILDAIHANCRSLSKLRITDSHVMTDSGFVRLFRDWENPGLSFIDFQKCRHLDAVRPRDNPDSIGLCSGGFKALMAHSGKTLKHLNIHACRHISRQTFEEVFSPEDKEYPLLTSLEVSFCEEVTDFVVGCIFRTCPELKTLNVFGCMKVKSAPVPRGKILVGVPNAMGMVIEGDD